MPSWPAWVVWMNSLTAVRISSSCFAFKTNIHAVSLDYKQQSAMSLKLPPLNWVVPSQTSRLFGPIGVWIRDCHVMSGLWRLGVVLFTSKGCRMKLCGLEMDGWDV